MPSSVAIIEAPAFHIMKGGGLPQTGCIRSSLFGADLALFMVWYGIVEFNVPLNTV